MDREQPSEGAAARHGALPVGARVEVRSRYDGSWQQGFVLEALTEAGCVLRRDGDRSTLPPLPRERVRLERRRETWWV